MSRLWGVWEPAFYGSGTTIVRLAEHVSKPWLYIYADAAIDETRYMRDRYAMCNSLCEFMNGGERPAWLDDFERQTEETAVALAGGSISATGPMVDVDPPNLNWRTDDRDQAKMDRALLMDVVFKKS